MRRFTLFRWIMWLDSFLGFQNSHSQGTRRDRGRRTKRYRRPDFTPRLEALEDRTVLSTFMVENLADSGIGSLRQAVLDANALRGADAIVFAEGLQGTIALTGGQLSITDSLTIDGPGAALLAVSGNHQSRVFDISGEAAVVIEDLTITGG